MHPDLTPERIERNLLLKPTGEIQGIIRHVNSVTRGWRRPLMALPLTLSLLALACQPTAAQTQETSISRVDVPSFSQEVPTVEYPIPSVKLEPLKAEPPPPPDKTKGLPDNAPPELKRLYGQVDEVAKYSTAPPEFSQKLKELFYNNAIIKDPFVGKGKLLDAFSILGAQVKATGNQALLAYAKELKAYYQAAYPDDYQRNPQSWKIEGFLD